MFAGVLTVTPGPLHTACLMYQQSMFTSDLSRNEMQEFNDALLTVLMSSLTKGSNQMLEYVEKINLAYSRP